MNDEEKQAKIDEMLTHLMNQVPDRGSCDYRATSVILRDAARACTEEIGQTVVVAAVGNWIVGYVMPVPGVRP